MANRRGFGCNDAIGLELGEIYCRKSAIVYEYTIDATKLKNDLGWVPEITFEEGLEKTVEWYLDNEEWLNDVTLGHYQQYYTDQYNDR